jgi:type IV secretory pathway VirB3-like protein
MRKTALTVLGVLLIIGSMVQIGAASERHMRKVHHAQMSTRQQFRNANNWIEYRPNSFRNDSSDFGQQNTFN